MVKVWGGVLTGVVALAISVMAFAGEPEKKPTLTQVTVAVTGFHCQACPDGLQKDLAKLKGVTKVKATLKPAQVTASLDEAKISVSQFVNAIAAHPTAMDKKKTYGATLQAFIDTPMCAKQATMCRACFTEIPKALTAVKGVHGVTLDKTGKIASIRFDGDAKVTTASLADALAKHKFKFTVAFTAPATAEAPKASTGHSAHGSHGGHH
jgi:copper chaperone CopZ